jgi:hypothetical protein
MDPAGGVRHFRLRPHEMTDPLTATGDLIVLAHLGIPHGRSASTGWSVGPSASGWTT